MATYLTPHQAVVAVIRASGCTTQGITNPPQRDFDWAAQPYYKDAKEPQPSLPYVVYDIPVSEGPEHTIGDSYPEKFKVEIEVVGLNPYIADIGSPYGDPKHSIIAYLDGLSAAPFVFNGERYICSKFIRLDWEIYEEDSRAPQDDSPAGGVYNSVYVAKATYEMEIGATYPTFTSGI